MRTLATWVAAGALTACAALPTGGGDAGPRGSGSGAAGEGDASADASVGLDCATDRVTNTTLCTGVKQCPELRVDHDAFPSCGFRPRAGGFDLACWCNGWVCPMGAPITCDDARRFLQTQTELVVCTQVNEGRCTQPQATGDGTAGSSGSTGGACTRECMRQCGQTPGCAQLCGC